MNRKQMVYSLISSLLQYPKEKWNLHEVWEVVALIPVKTVREPLVKFLAYLKDTPFKELSEYYVSAFGPAKENLPTRDMSYKDYKGIRDRGEALVQFLQEFHEQGVELSVDELLTYLPILLEFAAFAPEGQIDFILRQYKKSIDSLQLEFQAMNSPYRYLIEACMENLVVGDEPENEMVS